MNRFDNKKWGVRCIVKSYDIIDKVAFEMVK